MGFNTNRYTVCIPQIGFLIIPILYGMRFLLDQPTVCCPCDHVMATGICVFIMIDTLFQYVYHCKNDGIFPQKMTLISYAIYCHCICGDVLCFYLIQKRKFLMIYMLSITRWITCEWRLLCGPHFLSKTLCVTAPVVGCCSIPIHRPFFNKSEQMVSCTIWILLFYFGPHFCRIYLENNKCGHFHFCESVNV